MEYCPTVDMYEDFYTKPTQGGLYKTQWQAIMNLQSNDPNEYRPEVYKLLVSQQCVGKNHPNCNKVTATQIGEHKCVCRSRKVLTYAQAVIAGLKGGMSDVWYKCQQSY